MSHRLSSYHRGQSYLVVTQSSAVSCVGRDKVVPETWARDQWRRLAAHFFSPAVLLGLIPIFWVPTACGQTAQHEDFYVVAYNVENLFDLDGISLFDDYRAEKYGPKHLLRKLQNLASLLKTVNGGKGPDIILFQEIEADQTPKSGPFDYRGFLKKYALTSLEQMLTSKTLSDEIKDLPAEAWLLKALSDSGLGEFNVAVAEFRPDPTRTVAHVNATFSKFPIVETRTHQSNGARGALEVVHKIDGHRLHTFNNHWKSGATDPESEKIRLGNAQVVRDRLASILTENPAADIILGGDFNSQYNQSQAVPALTKTALNDILGSRGDEAAMVSDQEIVLYNLWYELPVEQRGSDVYRDQWGTLMQLIISRGLYNQHGIQYHDNSFGVLAVEGLNAQRGTGMPIRWVFGEDDGGGFSDHLPIYARFHVVNVNAPRRYIEIQSPGNEATGTAKLRWVDYKAALKVEHPSVHDLAGDNEIKDFSKLGHIFRVKGKVSGEKPLRIRIFEDDYNLWAFDVEMRRAIYAKLTVGAEFDIIAELGIHEGQWQFVIRDLAWLAPADASAQSTDQMNR